MDLNQVSHECDFFITINKKQTTGVTPTKLVKKLTEGYGTGSHFRNLHPTPSRPTHPPGHGYFYGTDRDAVMSSNPRASDGHRNDSPSNA